MRASISLILLLMGTAPLSRATAQDESCGPKSDLCWPRIERGASGSRVVALQFLLRSRGFKVAPDGRFGFSTESAVRRFQAKNRLKVDGKLGWQSFEKLAPNLKGGARGDAVRALQTLLLQSGAVVAKDGIYGIATQKALASFGSEVEPHWRDAKVDAREWCLMLGGYPKGRRGG